MIETLYEPMQPLAKKFIEEAAKNGINLRITAAYRTPEEQNRLYAQGRTIPGQIVTNARAWESYHNHGLAFDIVDREHGYNTDWRLLGKLARMIGLEHGVIPGTIYGDAGFVDAPHFQLTQGLSIADVRAGKRPVVAGQPPINNQEEDDDMLHLKIKEEFTLHPVPQYNGDKVSWYKYYVIRHKDSDPRETAYVVRREDLQDVLMLFDFLPDRKLEPSYIRGLTGVAGLPEEEQYVWDTNKMIEKFPSKFTRQS